MDHTQSGANSVDELLGEIALELVDRAKRGESLDLAEYERNYPDCIEKIQKLLPTIEAIADLVLSSDASPVSASPTDVSQQDSAATIDSGALRGPLHHLESKPLGDFRILRELGRGGMGIVYEAEQLSLARMVALKVLPYAAIMDQNAITRFKNESRAAASLDHPNIVSVYSVGEQRGVHYFAMQLVRGQSLAEVVYELRKQRPDRVPRSAKGVAESGRANTSSPQEASTVNDEETEFRSESLSPEANPHFYRSIARLGIQAAEALQHAHDQGVLHRDIKPGNLLLDAAGKLYVADFGLARLEADVGITMTGNPVGTLRYMSPEQALADGGVIDQRSDIYSLGATLYEVLTLNPIFDGSNRRELLRQITDESPASLRSLRRTIPKDLETIVFKAIEKEAVDRYRSAQDLAEDLKAFLQDKPIKAQPPGYGQLATKWARRHRSLVWSTAASSALVLLIAFIALLSSNHAIAEQKKIAEQKTTTTQAVIHFITDDLLAGADPMNQPDPDVKLRVVVDRAAAQVDFRFAGEPMVAAAVRMTLGRTYQSLGEFDASRVQYESALKTLQQSVGALHLDTLDCQRQLAALELDAGNDVEAERLLQSVFEQQVERLGDQHPATLRTMSDLADLCELCGRSVAARRLRHHVMKTQEELLGAYHPLTTNAKRDYAIATASMGDRRTAASLLKDVVVDHQRQFGEQHPETLESRLELASLLSDIGGGRTSTKELAGLRDSVTKLLGPEHPLSLSCSLQLAYAHIQCDELDKVERILQPAQQLGRESLGPEHTIVMQLDFARGLYEAAQNQHSQARDQMEQVLKRSRECFGESHPFTTSVKSELSLVYERLGWSDEARRMRDQITDGDFLMELVFSIGLESLSHRGKTRQERERELSGIVLKGLLEGHDVKLQGGASEVNGVIGQALSFDGRNSSAIVKGVVGFDPDQSMSILTWIQVNSFPDAKQRLGTVLACIDSKHRKLDYRLSCLENRQIQFELLGDANPAVVSAHITAGRMTHVAVLIDSESGVMRLFLDGTEVAHTQTEPRSRSRSQDIETHIEIGNHDESTPFHGVIDELQIKKRLVSREELLANRDASQLTADN